MTMKRNALGALAGVLVCAAFLVGGGSAAVVAKTCPLTPTLRDITINQGLQTYSVLARGKEALVRLYLSLPSCAVSGNSVQISKVTLTVSLKDAATSAAVGTQTITTPTPSLGAPLPQITNLFSSPPLTQIAPSDPVFIVPGSVLAPQGDTNRLVATFTASIDWQSVPAGQSGAGTALTSTTAGTAMTKTVEKQTRALRLLVVPMGGLLDSAGTTAIQNGMTALSRLYPVQDGTGGSAIRVGSLTSTDGGIRYGINNASLDLSALGIPFAPPNTLFCGNAASFGSAGSGLIDTQLSQFRQSWNSANPSYPADNVVGAIGESQSTGSATNPACDEARAAVNGRESWVRATSDTTGALLAMELEHNYGYVPFSRGDASFHSLYAHADHNVGDAYRGYNVSGRQFLSDDRSNMRFTPPGWTGLTALLEPPDWTDMLCVLGGPTTSECANAGTAGTVTGTAAGLTDPSPVDSFVVSGTTDGTLGGTNVLESYVASTVPTPLVSSSYHLFQLVGPFTPSSPNGTTLRDDAVPVSFDASNHDAVAGPSPATPAVGLFSFAVPVDSTATRIELRNGSTVLYRVDKSGKPTVAAGSGGVIVRRAQALHRSRVSPRATSPRQTIRRLAANGDNVAHITADQSGTACETKAISGGIGVGIAFDGSSLLLSCTNDNTITVVRPSGGSPGSQVGHYTVTSSNPDYVMSSLGALAYDKSRNVIWACNAENDVGTINPSTHMFTKAFASNGCLDGLAYDALDDTLWTSPDATSSISHYRASDGMLLHDPYTPILGSGGNSGIAVGGSTLYLANDGGSEIYTVPKDFSGPATLFASFSARLEDMECDNVSFASQSKTVIWSVDAYDLTLNAWEVPNGSCDFGGGSGDIKYTITDDSSNVTSDLYLKCPDSPVYNVVRVGIQGLNVSIPQTLGCAGGTFYAEAYDGFSSSGTLTDVGPSTFTLPPTLPLQPSVTSPSPGQTYSTNDDISLVGSAFDYSTGTAATLKWFSGVNQIAAGQQADVRASTLGVGSRTITLQATTGSGKVATVDIPITISVDADGDGIPAPREQVIDACAPAGSIPGDSDPTNGSKDYDHDGIPNRDDPFPCTPAGSYTAAAAIFLPDPISLSGTGSLSAGGMYVPYRDMTQLIPKNKSLPNVFIKEIGLGEGGTIPVNEQASGYIASGQLGAASFARAPLVAVLNANHIVNRNITLTITGTANDPLSGPWTFTAVVSTHVSN
jgi:hypothetical protein